LVFVPYDIHRKTGESEEDKEEDPDYNVSEWVPIQHEFMFIVVSQS